MKLHDPLYLLTVRMNRLEHWPFALFFTSLPTLDDVLSLLGNQPLPYSSASDVRDQAIALIRQHGLPTFEDRFPAAQLVLNEDRVEAGMVEIRKIQVYDNRPRSADDDFT